MRAWHQRVDHHIPDRIAGEGRASERLGDLLGFATFAAFTTPVAHLSHLTGFAAAWRKVERLSARAVFGLEVLLGVVSGVLLGFEHPMIALLLEPMLLTVTVYGLAGSKLPRGQLKQR